MAEPLKNMFHTQFLADLANAVKSVYPAFDENQFMLSVCDDQWEGRELKQRTRHITTVLGTMLPQDYPTALNLLRQASPLLNQYNYQNMIFPDFVETYGLNHREDSMSALEQFTQQSSGEFAIRSFIVQDENRAMAQMLAWSTHENHHVRRLSSEGSRPRLPWSFPLRSFKQNPAPILPILENLKNDPSEYVRRSVANNLNDMTKDHPDVVIQLLRRWNEHPTKEIQGITRHALRSLIKAGNPDALALLGYQNEIALSVNNLTVTPDAINFGEEIKFSFQIVSHSDHDQELVVDYVMYFVKANGKLAPKVFKALKVELPAHGIIEATRKHSFKPISTRRYYAGQHEIALKINGQLFERAVFILRG